MPEEEYGRNRLARAEKNEQAFKEHNERRAEIEAQGALDDEELVPFVCECDDPSCARPVSVSLVDYERVARPVDQFVVRPGHEDPTVEEVIERHEKYLVVSKPDLKRR
jgi:hypothetical protein